MNRETLREMLSEYLDGELTSEERLRVEQALANDAELRAELDALRRTVRSLSGLRDLPAPPEFARSVERKIRRRSRGRFFTRQPQRLPFEWFSFVIIMLLMTIYLMLGLGKPNVQQKGGKNIDSGTPASVVKPDSGRLRGQ